MPDVQLAIKTHPAETPDAYAAVAGGRAERPRAAGRRAARAAAAREPRGRHRQLDRALDAAVLGIPALVIGLPNNLSPFVEAGVMAGATPRRVARAGAAPNPV